MDSNAGSSLARRRHRPFSLFLYLSSPFVSFIDLLQVCLLFLGFLSSSFVRGCASCPYCHIQTCWLLFLTCSPAPSVTAALVPDLTFEGCVCTALSRSPKTAILSDLFFSSSSWAMNFLPMGKTCSNLFCCERSFCIGVFRCSFARSTSLGCSELYSASSEANRLLSEDPKTNHLSTPLPFTVAKPVLALLSITRQIHVTKGLTLVSSILFGSDTGRERSSSPSSSQERIFPPQSLLLRGDLLPVLKIWKIYLYPSHLLSYVKVRLGPVDATILIGLRVEVWDSVATSHVTVTNRSLFAEFEVRHQSLIDRIASGNFDILHNALSNFHKFVSLSLFYVGLYAWELACWLEHRVLYNDAFNLVIT
ncbi:hypothetical protein YC2023_086209 [Brassica napus]